MNAAFDAVANTYDTTFSDSHLGRLLRQRVWDAAAPLVSPGDRVLEIGCGTGVDAAWLAGRGARVLATDVSPVMVRQTAERGIAAAVLSAEAIGALRGPFDGVFSNFGALNCAANLPAVARTIGDRVQPGGWGVLVVLNRWCLWEIAAALRAGRPGQALARLRGRARVGIAAGSIAVRYPSLAAWRRWLAPAFTMHIIGLGTLPPTSAFLGFSNRHPGLIDRLNAWDRHAPAVFADHVILILRRL